VAEHFRHELNVLIDGLKIRDADQAQNFTFGLLGQISSGVTRGDWSEGEFPDEFDRLRDVLQDNRDFFLGLYWFMRDVIAYRSSMPRDHWWLWLEMV
jgi:hypothetical protein